MQQQFEGYLLLHNIAKPKNIGTIIRNAAAFNLKKIYMIGKEQQNKKKFQVVEGVNFFGNQGTFEQMDFSVFPSLKEAKEYFNQNNIFVCGVEIGEGCENIVNHPFKGNTVFFLGNEGTGLIPEHKIICDHFVYIPQYTQKTASLNVGVASGIIFHHFALWAGYKEQFISGEKFLNPEQKKEERDKRRQEMIEQGAEIRKMRQEKKQLKEQEKQEQQNKQFQQD